MTTLPYADGTSLEGETEPQPTCLDLSIRAHVRIFSAVRPELTLRCVLRGPADSLAFEEIDCTPGGDGSYDSQATIDEVTIEAVEILDVGRVILLSGITAGTIPGLPEARFRYDLELTFAVGAETFSGTGYANVIGLETDLKAEGSLFDPVRVAGLFVCALPSP